MQQLIVLSKGFVTLHISSYIKLSNNNIYVITIDITLKTRFKNTMSCDIKFLFVCLAFDFCRFCVIIRFFIPPTTADDLRLRRILSITFFGLSLFFRKSQYFLF